MNIALCCNNTTLLARWNSILTDHYTVYQATTKQDLSILLKDISFDCLLIHPSVVDVDTSRSILRTFPTLKLFVFSDRPNEEEGITFLKFGIVGYANSYISAPRLQEAISVVTSGSVWVNQRLMQRLIQGAPMSKDAEEEAGGQKESPLQRLSKREYQIAHLVAEGLSNPQIGQQLEITERTVKAHLSSIYSKTGTKGRLNLALLINT